MKRITILFLTAIMFWSCGDEIEFNTPAFQGDRENELWRAVAFSASIDENGFLTITGTNNFETVNLTVPTVAVGTYIVGDVNSIEAQYIDSSGTTFTTNNRPDPSVSIYPELGEIIIEDIDAVNGHFTGTFRFLAFDTSGFNSIGYTNGIFYQVPLISGAIPGDPITCQDVTDAADTAQTAFDAASSTGGTGFFDSATYETACAAYVDALINKRNYCGDLDGSIQALIDGLGDCTYTCEFANANAIEAEMQFTTSTMGNYIANCNQYALYLQEQITYCGDTDGSIQAIIDGLDCGDQDNDGVPNVYEDFNGDGDLTNDDTDMDLNPDYVDDDDDDDGVRTDAEVMFDADGNPADTDGDGTPDYFDTDDDGDGILTIDEDIDGDGDPTNDDTDGDGIPNYLDTDDDGDGILTVFEDLNGDTDPSDDDTDGDTIPNYLDVDDDGDSVYTSFEFADQDGDGNPADARDFDSDGTPDYLDTDDDQDGILTINENPDPNGDGDPADAANTDADAFPDYLDA